VFILIIGGTELGTIPGLSAAGSNSQMVAYTAPADAEVLWRGKPQIIDALPVDPEGHPTPALISRTAYLEARFPVLIVRAGTFLPPTVPYVETSASPGKDPRQGKAVEEAFSLWEKGRRLGEELSKTQNYLVIAESLPGGTTSALCVLRALGYNGMVSSAFPHNPVPLKEKIWQEVSFFQSIGYGSFRGEGLKAVESCGDPMQAVAGGLVEGALSQCQVVLAGGTQMLAVSAVLRHQGYSRPLFVATTRYVIEDKSAHFQEIAQELGVEVYSAPLDFSHSPFPGLLDYERGFVKEGVGAGGAVWYAEKLGSSVKTIISRVEELYGNFFPEGLDKGNS